MLEYIPSTLDRLLIEYEYEYLFRLACNQYEYLTSVLKVAGRPILMRFITFKVAVLFQQWTSVLTSSSMQFVCLSIGIDYSKF